MYIKNSELIGKIFIAQSLLEKVSNEIIFKDFKITASLYGPMKMIESGLDTIYEMKKFVTETPASLTQKINKLEKLGYLKRSLNKKDKRIWNFTITAKGKKMIEKVNKLSNENSCVFEIFSEREKECFAKILDTIGMEIIKNIKKYNDRK